MEPRKIWAGQCDAAKRIEDDFGVGQAIDYLVGEKSLIFLEAAGTDAEFRAEIPSFAAEVRTIFERWQLAEYLETARQSGPFDPDIDGDEDPEDAEMYRREDIVARPGDRCWSSGNWAKITWRILLASGRDGVVPVPVELIPFDPQLLHLLLAYLEPLRYSFVSSAASIFNPASVRVLPMRLTITSRLRNGLPRQFSVMWQNIRCSILFHLLVPGVTARDAIPRRRPAGGRVVARRLAEQPFQPYSRAGSRTGRASSSRWRRPRGRSRRCPCRARRGDGPARPGDHGVRAGGS